MENSLENPEVASEPHPVTQRARPAREARPPSHMWAVTSALIVPLPGELHPEVETIRATHDKAFARWMPHINLMFPFVEDDTLSLTPSALISSSTAIETSAASSSSSSSSSSSTPSKWELVGERLKEGLKDFPEFVMQFPRLHAFKQGKRQTVHLEPETNPPDAFDTLYKALLKIFPHYLKEAKARHELVPHLTLGQWPSDLPLDQLEAKLALSKIKSSTIFVDHLEMISRTQDGRFSEKIRIPLMPNPELREAYAGEDNLNSPEDEAVEIASAQAFARAYLPAESKTYPLSLSEDNVLVKLSIPDSGLASKKERKVVFVCDTSGSMSGFPRDAILKTVEELELEGYQFDIINYSSLSFLLTGRPTKYAELAKTWQNNQTYFCLAFQTMISMLSDPRNAQFEFDFIFLTDGSPSDNPFSGSPNLSDLTKAARNHRESVVFHSFGLGGQSNLQLLEKIRVAGDKEGVYVYATTKDHNITSELRILMNFASKSAKGNVILDAEGAPQPGNFYIEDDAIIGEIWTTKIPEKVVVELENGQRTTLNVQAMSSSYEYDLNRARRDVYLIKNQRHIIEMEKFLEDIRLSAPRYARREVMAEVADLEQELNQVRSILSKEAESHLYSQSDLLNRFKAMAFKGKMSKARREATMDRRILTNARLLKNMEQKLAKIRPPSQKELEDLAADPTFRDDISQETLSDILTSDPADFLTFGLQVERNEVAIDQPVVVKVTLGNTLVSWTTIEGAAEYQWSRGNSSATGTFDISTVSRIMSGMSNECINAGLPLYGCETHYCRVRTMLPVILGYFFTLAPGGFSPKQIPALFAILARLHRQAHNERSRWIVSQFRQLCRRIMHDGRLLDHLRVPEEMKPLNIIQRFATDISSHEKSELPSLDIVYGCLLADPDAQSIPANLSSILLAESIRRQLNFVMMESEKGGDLFFPIAKKMVFGPQASSLSAVAIKTPPKISPEGVYTPAEFQPYEPFPPVRYLTSGILAQLNIPENFEEYVQQTKCLGLTLTQEQYEKLLYPCILQGVYAPGNSRFSKLIESGGYILDPTDETQIERLFQKIYNHFDTVRREKWAATLETQQNEENALFIVYSESLDEFMAGIRALEVTRGKKIWQDIILQLMPPDVYPLVPNNTEKLAMILSGKTLDGQPLIEDGTPWMAGKFYGHLCRCRLKATEYNYIIEELDAQSLQHVYRSSDSPNRHGHCRSNPLWIADPDNPSVPYLIKKWDK